MLPWVSTYGVFAARRLTALGCVAMSSGSPGRTGCVDCARGCPSAAFFTLWNPYAPAAFASAGRSSSSSQKSPNGRAKSSKVSTRANGLRMVAKAIE